ncbi:hypothetical protein GCM10010343_30060 [Streptomyces avidinii]|nr:hypothetical protein GCM10010343_30060 [Streptomyces avidinii]
MDSPAVEWGLTIDRVEIKDVSLPEAMKRSVARQAEADRERGARIINADAELQASEKQGAAVSRGQKRVEPALREDGRRMWGAGRVRSRRDVPA